MAANILYDCIVVGAGISGLTCARRLDHAGLRVLVLEARDRVGGRTLSHQLKHDIIDLGGQWIGPTQNRVAALAKELDIQTFPQYTTGKKILVMNGEVRTYNGLIPKMPLRAILETGLRMWNLDRKARRTQPIPNSDLLKTWDSISVGEWMDINIKHPEARKVLNVATQMVFATEPHELSFLFFLYYIKSGQGLNRLTLTEGGAQQTRFTTGAQTLSLRMAEDLPGRIRLKSPVTYIEQRNDFVAIKTQSSQTRKRPTKSSSTSRASSRQFNRRRGSEKDFGLEFLAKKLVLALPPPLLNDIDFNPPMPTAREELHAQMPMGSVIKFVIAYNTPFWREQGFSGEAVFTNGPVRALFDDCSDDLKQCALVGFIIADEAKKFTELSTKKRHQAIVESVTLAFGPQAKDYTEIIDQDWLGEQYSKGCYVGVMPPGLMSKTATALRQVVGDIHFAGTETATRWNGYFDGAIEAGERAANEVIVRLQ